MQQSYARGPSEPTDDQLHGRRIDALWGFVQDSSYVAFLEIAMAARTDPHLGELVTRMKSEPAKAIVYGSYNDPAAARFLAQRTGITAVQLPYTVGGSDRAKDLFGLFDDTIDRLLVAANAAPAKP